MTPDISCRRLTHMQLQIPRWRTKWRQCKGMSVSQAFIFHFKWYSLLHFAVCQLLCWAFLLAKILERVDHKQMTGYLQQDNLLPEFQSANRHHHSTESAVLKVFSDIALMPRTGATSFCSPSLTCQPLAIWWTMISCGKNLQGHVGFELSRSSSWTHT